MADQAAEAVDLASKQDGQVGVRAAAGSASIVRAADCSARRAPSHAYIHSSRTWAIDAMSRRPRGTGPCTEAGPGVGSLRRPHISVVIAFVPVADRDALGCGGGRR